MLIRGIVRAVPVRVLLCVEAFSLLSLGDVVELYVTTSAIPPPTTFLFLRCSSLRKDFHAHET